jgi:acyl-coenzyme A thioesterase PaaI-like protein
VTWQDPGPATAKGLSMAGIDYLRAMVEGALPPAPITGLMQFAITDVEPGRVVFTCVPDESAYNPIGAIHGGLLCTLLDSVTGCAVHSTLPQGKGYTSVEIKENYL